MAQKIGRVLGIVGAAFLVATVLIVTKLPSLRVNGPAELLSTPRLSVLSLVQTLEQKDAVPKNIAMASAATMSILSSNCGGGGAGDAGSFGQYRAGADYAEVKRNRDNWRDTLGLFVNAQEVEQIVMNDAENVHVLIYVAPSWCKWSRKEVYEIHEHFQDLGPAARYIHLLDVDDPDNTRLISWEGVTSYPTMVVVKGNHIVTKIAGYQGYNKVRDLANTIA